MSLPEPVTAAGRQGLAALLADPGGALIAVDYDGTLAPIVDRPAEAHPAPGAVAALAALAPRVAMVAIVTGRPVHAVLRFLDLEQVDGLADLVIAGHYGLERFVGGRTEAPLPEPGVGQARARLPAMLANAPAGVSLEDKGHSLVVHTRQAAEPAGALAALTPALTELAGEVGLVAAPGRFVLELRPGAIDKGGALRRLVAECGARSILFVGDDLGDLPAFDVVEAVRAQGVPGLTVCSASAEVSALRDRADLVVDGPEGVVTLLRTLVQSAA